MTDDPKEPNDKLALRPDEPEPKADAKKRLKQSARVAADTAKDSAVGFYAGFMCLFKGFRFAYKEHDDLLKYCIPPMLLAIGMVLGGWIYFGVSVGGWIDWLWSEPNPESFWGIWHALWSFLTPVISVLLFIILAAAVAVFTVIIYSILAAPFSDFISEQAEGKLGTWDPRPFSFKFMMVDLWHTVKMELFRTGLKAMWLVPLLIANFVIPVVGPVLYTVLGTYILCKHTGMDYVDWCAARRGWGYKKRLAFAKKHRFAYCGLGAGVVLFLMIPGAYAIVWPAAVSGGAILFTTLQKSEGSTVSDSTP